MHVCVHVCVRMCVLYCVDMAVSAQAFDGSDAGATPDEAVSWGKIKMNAKPIKVCPSASVRAHGPFGVPVQVWLCAPPTVYWIHAFYFVCKCVFFVFWFLVLFVFR